MTLNNGYKIIYESRTITTALERHLKATKTVPATTDVNLTYKDATGATISTETLNSYKLVYEKDGNLYGSTSTAPTSADTMILVYNGEDLVLGVINSAE